MNKTLKKMDLIAVIAALIGILSVFTACDQPDESIAVASVTLNKTTLAMTVGDEETLTAVIAPSNATNQNVEWLSSAPAVVSVSNGKVTALTAGSGTITVKTQDGGKIATCAVVVTNSLPPGNKPPTITTAGTDLPANTGALTADGLTVNLTGAAADPDGDTLSYQWQCTGYDHGAYVVTGAGSAAAGINSGIGGASGNGTAAVTLRKAGTYTFKLSVSDSVNSAVESDAVTVTVNPQELTKTGYSIPSINGVTSAVNSFSFVQVYTVPTGGWNTDFPSTALTYTLTAEGTSAGDTSSSLSAVGRANGMYLVSQTFYYNGTPIQDGNRSIALEVNSDLFVDSYKSKTDFSVFNAPVPALNNLTLRVEKTEVLPPPDAVVSFVTLAASFSAVTIDFSPSAALPVGVTYTVTDNSSPQKSWSLGVNGFTGSITASEHYSVAGAVTFTQTFYLNGTKITGANSERTVVVNVSTFGGVRFSSVVPGSDTGDVTLWYNP